MSLDGVSLAPHASTTVPHRPVHQATDVPEEAVKDPSSGTEMTASPDHDDQGRKSKASTVREVSPRPGPQAADVPEEDVLEVPSPVEQKDNDIHASMSLRTSIRGPQPPALKRPMHQATDAPEEREMDPSSVAGMTASRDHDVAEFVASAGRTKNFPKQIPSDVVVAPSPVTVPTITITPPPPAVVDHEVRVDDVLLSLPPSRDPQSNVPTLRTIQPVVARPVHLATDAPEEDDGDALDGMSSQPLSWNQPSDGVSRTHTVPTLRQVLPRQPLQVAEVLEDEDDDDDVPVGTLFHNPRHDAEVPHHDPKIPPVSSVVPRPAQQRVAAVEEDEDYEEDLEPDDDPARNNRRFFPKGDLSAPKEKVKDPGSVAGMTAPRGHDDQGRKPKASTVREVSPRPVHQVTDVPEGDVLEVPSPVEQKDNDMLASMSPRTPIRGPVTHRPVHPLSQPQTEEVMDPGSAAGMTASRDHSGDKFLATGGRSKVLSKPVPPDVVVAPSPVKVPTIIPPPPAAVGHDIQVNNVLARISSRPESRDPRSDVVVLPPVEEEDDNAPVGVSFRPSNDDPQPPAVPTLVPAAAVIEEDEDYKEDLDAVGPDDKPNNTKFGLRGTTKKKVTKRRVLPRRNPLLDLERKQDDPRRNNRRFFPAGDLPEPVEEVMDPGLAAGVTASRDHSGDKFVAAGGRSKVLSKQAQPESVVSPSSVTVPTINITPPPAVGHDIQVSEVLADMSSRAMTRDPRSDVVVSPAVEGVATGVTVSRNAEFRASGSRLKTWGSPAAVTEEDDEALADMSSRPPSRDPQPSVVASPVTSPTASLHGKVTKDMIMQRVAKRLAKERKRDDTSSLVTHKYFYPRGPLSIAAKKPRVLPRIQKKKVVTSVGAGGSFATAPQEIPMPQTTPVLPPRDVEIGVVPALTVPPMDQSPQEVPVSSVAVPIITVTPPLLDLERKQDDPRRNNRRFFPAGDLSEGAESVVEGTLPRLVTMPLPVEEVMDPGSAAGMTASRDHRETEFFVTGSRSKTWGNSVLQASEELEKDKGMVHAGMSSRPPSRDPQAKLLVSPLAEEVTAGMIASRDHSGLVDRELTSPVPVDHNAVDDDVFAGMSPRMPIRDPQPAAVSTSVPAAVVAVEDPDDGPNNTKFGLRGTTKKKVPKQRVLPRHNPLLDLERKQDDPRRNNRRFFPKGDLAEGAESVVEGTPPRLVTMPLPVEEVVDPGSVAGMTASRDHREAEFFVTGSRSKTWGNSVLQASEELEKDKGMVHAGMSSRPPSRDPQPPVAPTPVPAAAVVIEDPDDGPNNTKLGLRGTTKKKVLEESLQNEEQAMLLPGLIEEAEDVDLLGDGPVTHKDFRYTGKTKTPKAAAAASDDDARDKEYQDDSVGRNNTKFIAKGTTHTRPGLVATHARTVAVDTRHGSDEFFATGSRSKTWGKPALQASEELEKDKGIVHAGMSSRPPSRDPQAKLLVSPLAEEVPVGITGSPDHSAVADRELTSPVPVDHNAVDDDALAGMSSRDPQPKLLVSPLAEEVPVVMTGSPDHSAVVDRELTSPVHVDHNVVDDDALIGMSSQPSSWDPPLPVVPTLALAAVVDDGEDVSDEPDEGEAADLTGDSPATHVDFRYAGRTQPGKDKQPQQMVMVNPLDETYGRRDSSGRNNTRFTYGGRMQARERSERHALVTAGKTTDVAYGKKTDPGRNNTKFTYVGKTKPMGAVSASAVTKHQQARSHGAVTYKKFYPELALIEEDDGEAEPDEATLMPEELALRAREDALVRHAVYMDGLAKKVARSRMPARTLVPAH